MNMLMLQTVGLETFSLLAVTIRYNYILLQTAFLTTMKETKVKKTKWSIKSKRTEKSAEGCNVSASHMMAFLPHVGWSDKESLRQLGSCKYLVCRKWDLG